jgi:hypothetical protein
MGGKVAFDYGWERIGYIHICPRILRMDSPGLCDVAVLGVSVPKTDLGQWL